MKKVRLTHSTAAGVVIAAALTLTCATTASAQPHQPRPSMSPSATRPVVDEAKLVPLLSPTFVPWTCRQTRRGPVCQGERHLRIASEVTDLPCSQPLWDRYTEDRYQTRYYGRDNLNYFRTFRTENIDYFATSAEDSTPAVLRTKVKFFETFEVRGDDQTLTITSHGLLWDLRTGSGTPVLRVKGTLVEPYNGPATLTGIITKNGVTTSHVSQPLDDVLEEDEIFRLVCQAAISET